MYQKVIYSFLICVSGCVSMLDTETMMRNMYNIPTSGVSQFDGTKHIRMSNMYCSNNIILEMYQDTNKAQKGVVLVKAGVNSVANIGRDSSLLFKIDGDIRPFSPTSKLTEHSEIYFGHGVSMPYSFKSYLIPEKIVREMALAKELMAKLYLLNNTYVEGNCSAVDFYTYKKNNPNIGSKITQEDINMSNLAVAQVGIKNFIKLIDDLAW